MITEIGRLRGFQGIEVAVAVGALVSAILVCVEIWWRLDASVAELVGALGACLDQFEHGMTA